MFALNRPARSGLVSVLIGIALLVDTERVPRRDIPVGYVSSALELCYRAFRQRGCVGLVLTEPCRVDTPATSFWTLKTHVRRAALGYSEP
jgi:hypothetical protein